MNHTVYGIRHHGPGCARHLLQALERQRPDRILVEGPSEADTLIPFLTHEGMTPPVALLLYQPDEPQRAVFYPFAEFSPEWQALRFGLRHGIPAGFMDLPHTIRFHPDNDLEPPGGAPADDLEPATDDPERAFRERVRNDPIGVLAEAAGYTDHELWWEHQVEQRADSAGLFESIAQAMASLREGAGTEDRREALREAWMRRTIREAVKDGAGNIAVICGAWHAPALLNLPPAAHDAGLLKGLKKTAVEMTWTPWTHSRLAYTSGYGAGILSPGWYQHIWNAKAQAHLHWTVQAARLLRSEDLEASSANVIDAVRLAEALAALRNIPLPGLAELTEAIQASLCHGRTAPLALIQRNLVIGTRLGEVPEGVPTTPFQKDLEALQKRLRLKPVAETRRIDLDLRQDFDREKSRLLHRLEQLSIPWGARVAAGPQTSTFHEYWDLKWDVAFAVNIIEAGVWGNTVEAAAHHALCDRAEKSGDLPGLTRLLDGAVLAGLTSAVPIVLERIENSAALSADIRHMLLSLLPLARVARYGDVRGNTGVTVLPIFRHLLERIGVGLPGTVAGIDETAAREMLETVATGQAALELIDQPEWLTEWNILLERLLPSSTVHPLLRGFFCRLLLVQNRLADEALTKLAGCALSPALPPEACAQWLEGLLWGSGLLLLGRDDLWRVLDAWLMALDPSVFLQVLPMLRRAFATFQQAELEGVGRRIRSLGLKTTTAGHPANKGRAGRVGLDAGRVAQVLPILRRILGEEAS